MAGHIDRRIVLLGKSGTGKSASGNTILQRKRFPLNFDIKHIKTECSLRQSFDKSKNINYKVLDTPGFWDDTGLLPDVGYLIQQQTMELCDEPHAFLLVVDPDDCHDTLQLVDVLRTWFGMTMLEHTIVVFTKGNSFKSGESLLGFMKMNGLVRLVDQFGSRIIHMENHGDGRSKSRQELLSMVQKTSRNGRTVFRFATITPLYKFKRARHQKSGVYGVSVSGNNSGERVHDTRNKLSEVSSTHDEPIEVIHQPSRLGARPKEATTKRESQMSSDTVLAGTVSTNPTGTVALNERKNNGQPVRKPLMKKDVKKTLECAVRATDAIRNIRSSPAKSVTTLALLASDEESIEAIRNVANSEEVQTAVEATWSFLTEAATAFGKFASNVADEIIENQRIQRERAEALKMSQQNGHYRY